MTNEEEVFVFNSIKQLSDALVTILEEQEHLKKEIKQMKEAAHNDGK